MAREFPIESSIRSEFQNFAMQNKSNIFNLKVLESLKNSIVNNLANSLAKSVASLGKSRQKSCQFWEEPRI